MGLMNQVLSIVQSIPIKLHSTRSMSITVKSLLYKEYSEPADVLQISTSILDKPCANEVSIKWLLAPVNPADINTIQGKYPSKPSLPAIPGNEGVGEIIDVGSGIIDFNIGDKVVPKSNHLGTWRTHANHKSTDIMKVPKGVGIIEASTINVNPPTAYRMLKDFVTLKTGDTVIQNGGNSAVGQLVIQLSKAWGYKTISVVRDRPDINSLKKRLIDLGADQVFTEEEIRSTTIFKNKQFNPPKLALNCVCGQSSTNILRHLDWGGVMVTYGGMSREPITIPPSALIFKNISLKGFWMTAWTKANSDTQERTNMFEEIGQLYENNELRASPYELVPFDEYRDVMKKALNANGKIGVKYILDMRD